MMGSPPRSLAAENDEKQHVVSLTNDYYIQTTEVTQGQWIQLMEKNPSKFSECGKNCPVENVSWDDVQKYISRLNEIHGEYQYRLPTEAEWEYACRSGTKTPFPYGHCLSIEQANYDGKYPMVNCPKEKRRRATIQIGILAPNAWQLFDMNGNVSEWCQDWYDKYQNISLKNPSGPYCGEGI